MTCVLYHQALQKKQLIAAGKLEKYGKPNDKTPKEWLEQHPDIRCAANLNFPPVTIIKTVWNLQDFKATGINVF